MNQENQTATCWQHPWQQAHVVEHRVATQPTVHKPAQPAEPISRQPYAAARDQKSMPHLILAGGCHTDLYFLRCLRPLYLPNLNPVIPTPTARQRYSNISMIIRDVLMTYF
jgi:hypothetical protein